jgi:peptide chain release factor 1
MEEMAYLEIGELKEQEEATFHELQKLLIPTDPNDKKNVIIEIRAGAGGDEAGLFASELMRMYLRYAESRRWKTEMIEISETGVGGIKEASFIIKGNGAYSRLKFESGTHRVQRVPATESGGRIHTSTATVAVLPEVDEVEIDISPNDIRVDVFRSGGHGGQSVNTTDSAVRVTHLPSGIVATCQDGKSQQMNKEQAMRVLRARLYEKALTEQTDAIASQRRLQIGTGDRSAKIRTYNFPQSRITDHRIHMTTHQLESFLLGDIDEMVDALITYHQAEALQEIES